MGFRQRTAGNQTRIKEVFNPETRLVIGSFQVVDPNGAALSSERMYKMKVYSANEFTAMAKACGFSQVRVYGDMFGRHLSQRSEEMIVLATKAPTSDEL